MGMATGFASSVVARVGIAGAVCMALALPLQIGCSKSSNIPSVPALPPNDTPEGKLALLVPAHRFLYGEFDRALGHFRRYGRRELAAKLGKAGFVVREMNFFSLAAALPWLINGRLLKRDYIPAGQANLANLLVPLLKLERLIGPPCGLSLIAIAQK